MPEAADLPNDVEALKGLILDREFKIQFLEHGVAIFDLTFG
jgi:hypothetical protein